VIPRGIKFKVDLDPEVECLQQDAKILLEARGYICEIYKSHFTIPDLGPIGANGLANPSHFEYPVAWYEDDESKWRILNKFSGKFIEYS
jgi:homogentisate 1,2-dioxygenase